MDPANGSTILAETVRPCTVKFEHCQIACWDRYEVVIKEKECLEKDHPVKTIRCYHWAHKSQRRKTSGTGRMQYLKHVARRAKNGFRVGTTAPARTKREAK